MKIIILLLCFLSSQLNFGQRAFVHSYYENCNFFKELSPKEIEDYVTIKKDSSRIKITFKIPLSKNLKEFAEINFTTYDTKFQKYSIGHDADNWLEIDESSHTGSILVHFKTNCIQKETYSGVDSSGFIELTGDSTIDKISGFYHANVDGVIITGAFKNIAIN